MKNAKELAYYTHINQKAMRKWYNDEYNYTKKNLDSWLKDTRIRSKKDDDFVSDFGIYKLDADTIVNNYMIALHQCHEKFTIDTVTDAVDILLCEMADSLTEHMRAQYPCLKRHRVCMRANKLGECGMYIGPCIFSYLFDDENMFMTQGIDKCTEVLASSI